MRIPVHTVRITTRQPDQPFIGPVKHEYLQPRPWGGFKKMVFLTVDPDPEYQPLEVFGFPGGKPHIIYFVTSAT